MSDYSVKLEGADQVIAKLNSINSQLRQQAALDAVEAGAHIIRDKAVMNAPVLTGTLRKSAKVSAHNTASGAEAEIGFRGLAYAKIQEFGGTINARNAKYLKFRYKGQWVSKKSVTIRGKHYLGDAIDSERGLVVKAMADAVEPYLR